MVTVEDREGALVGAQIGPDVFNRIQFGRIGRQGQERDGVGHGEALRAVPSRPVEDQDGMGSGGNSVGDLGQIGVHRLRLGAGQDEARRDRACRADRAEPAGRGLGHIPIKGIPTIEVM